jgi:uncharacterized membrane protein
MSYVAAAYSAQMGYYWLDFWDRPEHFLLLGSIVFALPFYCKHSRNADFPPVYRVVGALTSFIAILSLAEWGIPSYLPWETINIERFYEIAGVLLAAAVTWLGVLRNWNGLVNTGALFFIFFLFARLYHWFWDWIPRYLFCAIFGAAGIALVLVFKRVRNRMIHLDDRIPA